MSFFVVPCLICLASLESLAKQDLAVVVLLILIPLISPNSSKGGVSIINLLLHTLDLSCIECKHGSCNNSIKLLSWFEHQADSVSKVVDWIWNL